MTRLPSKPGASLVKKPSASTVKGIVVSMPRASSVGAILLPDLEVLGAMAGRGVDEARAGIVGDMLAGEQRHIEVVAALAKRMRRDDSFESRPRHVAESLPSRHARSLEDLFGEVYRQGSACRLTFAQLSSGASVTS